MLALSKALLLKPAILLIDELSLGLAPLVVQQLLAVVERLKAEGMTMVIVTHEIGFARDVADRVVVLDGGTILEDGPPGQVLVSPKSERVKAFLSRH